MESKNLVHLKKDSNHSMTFMNAGLERVGGFINRHAHASAHEVRWITSVVCVCDWVRERENEIKKDDTELFNNIATYDLMKLSPSYFLIWAYFPKSDHELFEAVNVKRAHRQYCQCLEKKQFNSPAFIEKYFLCNYSGIIRNAEMHAALHINE